MLQISTILANLKIVEIVSNVSVIAVDEHIVRTGYPTTHRYAVENGRLFAISSEFLWSY